MPNSYPSVGPSIAEPLRRFHDALNRQQVLVVAGLGLAGKVGAPAVLPVAEPLAPVDVSNAVPGQRAMLPTPSSGGMLPRRQG